MSGFAEVMHREWIAAPVATVRSQFADLDHHIHTNVHPKLRFEILSQSPGRARYVQVVKLLGIKQRDVFEREIFADGRMVDTSVEGFNCGGSLAFDFKPESQGGQAGTAVEIRIRLPLPPVVGGLVKSLLESQIRKEVRAAAGEDKFDLEQRGYLPASLRTQAA